MHELSYVVRFCNQAIETAEKNHALSVERVVVEVGEMTDIVPEYLHRYYPGATRGTILEGSELVTRIVPVRVRCGGCGQEYHPGRENDYRCPSCGSLLATLLQGRGLVLSQVVLTTADGEGEEKEEEER